MIFEMNDYRKNDLSYRDRLLVRRRRESEKHATRMLVLPLEVAFIYSIFIMANIFILSGGPLSYLVLTIGGVALLAYTLIREKERHAHTMYLINRLIDPKNKYNNQQSYSRIRNNNK